MSIGSCCRAILKSASARSDISLKNFATFLGDTVDLSYTSYGNIKTGSRDAVMVLHGLLLSSNAWRNFSEGLHQNTGRNVINVDARNHGSSPHSSQHTYIHMANDTKKLIDTLPNLPKLSFLGHSMGGRTAMTLSLLYPELVSSLIIIDISPVSMSKTLTAQFPPILEFATTLKFHEFTTVEAARSYAKDKLYDFGITQETLEIIVTNVGVKPDGTVGWTCNIDVLKQNFWTLTRFPFIPKSFAGPVLLIAGGNSDFVPPEDIDGIKQYFPQAELVYVPGVRHNIQEEQPDTLLKLVTDFLIKTKS